MNKSGSTRNYGDIELHPRFQSSSMRVRVRARAMCFSLARMMRVSCAPHGRVQGIVLCQHGHGHGGRAGRSACTELPSIETRLQRKGKEKHVRRWTIRVVRHASWLRLSESSGLLWNSVPIQFNCFDERCRWLLNWDWGGWSIRALNH